jgi:ribonuclease P protein component
LPPRAAATLGARTFGPDRRVRKHDEFVRAQRLARRVGTSHFTLLVAPQPEQPDQQARPARLGLVVSRKVGGAVQRNRVKRLCRECFRHLPELLPNGVDLIVIAREGAHQLGLVDVRAEWRSVEGLLKKRAMEALARMAQTPVGEVPHRAPKPTGVGHGKPGRKART